jgi:biopolymer transport protein TolR
MGVSLPGGGGGRGKSMNANLNLVPFIDLLSTCITFLLATAVWNQTNSLEVEQSISDPNTPPPEPPETPPTPPLNVVIRGDIVQLFRTPDNTKSYNKKGEDFDWEALDKDLKADHEQYPTETQVTIATEDGVQYHNMIKVLDLTRLHGYDKTALASAPKQNTATLPPPAQ